MPPKSSPATAAGNARSAATIVDKFSEPSDCPAGRRFACSALVEQSRLRGGIVERRRFSIGIGFEVARLWEKGFWGGVSLSPL